MRLSHSHLWAICGQALLFSGEDNFRGWSGRHRQLVRKAQCSRPSSHTVYEPRLVLLARHHKPAGWIAILMSLKPRDRGTEIGPKRSRGRASKGKIAGNLWGVACVSQPTRYPARWKMGNQPSKMKPEKTVTTTCLHELMARLIVSTIALAQG